MGGVCALFSHFWYVGGFGDLGDTMLPTFLGHANCPPPWHTFARFYTQKKQCKKLPFFERVFSRPMKLGVQNTLSTLLLHDD